MTKVAVVILNYNGRDFLDKFLPLVLQYSTEAEVIVADNASTDDSIKLLNEQFKHIRRIELSENHGFAGGYNEALKEIDAEYFILLNSDVEVTSNWISPIITFLDSNTSYAACQPKILDYNQRESFEYAGSSGGFIDFLGYPFCRGRIFDTIEKDQGQYDDSIDIFWASGACLFIRSQVFKDIGGFDADFFAHMEEIDLCWRIHSLGLKTKCIPSSTVFHVGGGTLAKTSSFKTYLNFRNGLYILIKNLPLKKLFLKFPARIVLDWIAALKFLIEGNGKHSLAVIKAHLAMTQNLIKMLKKRRLISSSPKSKLIIYEYYFKGNKKFVDI
jgi:GT2 family glycosyltransferase